MNRPGDTRWFVQAAALPGRMAASVVLAAGAALALAGAVVLAHAGSEWAVPAAMAAAAMGTAGSGLYRRPGPRALRAAAGSRWWLRRGAGWQPARLLRSWRGPGWLTLALAEPDDPSRPVHVTVWRCAMAPRSWRRLRVLAAVPAPRAGRV